MAIEGSLSEFSVADVFQLIGGQVMSGVLHLSFEQQELQLAFSGGSIVRLESGSDALDPLGQFLVDAELLTQGQLDEARRVQIEMPQWLGDILLAKRFLTQDQLSEMSQLQVTEAVHRVLDWTGGTYRFEPGALALDRTIHSPLRSDSLLMEHLRRAEEWPAIRVVVPSLGVLFEPVGRTAANAANPAVQLGPNEKRLFDLIPTPRTARQLVGLSKLGEFEACAALTHLVQAGLVRAVAPADEEETTFPSGQSKQKQRLPRALAQLAALSLILAAGLWLAVARRAHTTLERLQPLVVQDSALQEIMASYQLVRIERQLAAERLEAGEYPERLEKLASEGLLPSHALVAPEQTPYYYRRRSPNDYVLLSPQE